MTERVFGYVEVTVAAALLSEAGEVVNGDYADVTLAFGLRTPPPPRPLTEEETKQVVAMNLRRVLAAIEAMLITNGVVHLGQVEEPLVGRGTVVGSTMAPGVRVHLYEEPQGGSGPS